MMLGVYVVRRKDVLDAPAGRLLWNDNTFALVKYYVHDKPVVEYLSRLEIIEFYEDMDL